MVSRTILKVQKCSVDIKLNNKIVGLRRWEAITLISLKFQHFGIQPDFGIRCARELFADD